MTLEEAIRWLNVERELIVEIPQDNSRELKEAYDIAIKALEQKSVLSKIRAEIELHRRKTESIDPYDLVGDCLDIIDKYRAESEE